MTQSIPSRELDRCKFVYEQVFSWTSLAKTLVTVRGLPVTLRMQGLVLVVAELMRKNETDILAILVGWLLPTEPGKRRAYAQDLLKLCVSVDRERYLALQQEAMILVERTKLIAEARHKAEKG